MPIFAVYKPKGLTSHDIIQRIRKFTGIKKVGHAGTLDPLATGVLVIAVNREATKKINIIAGKEKEYLATVKLGENSSTDDAEGKKLKVNITSKPTPTDIRKNIKKFIGNIQQTPPIFSAIKIKGKEAYKLARGGKVFELKPRPVIIKKIALQNYWWPFVMLRVVTGPGVYIRSLARDLGKELRTGGYLWNLERIRVGGFVAEKAVKMSSLESYLKKARIIETKGRLN